MAGHKQVRDCGDCTLCCKVLTISSEDLKKPAGKWCEHCNPGKGCRIYEERPETCQTFVCFWAAGWIPEELKPNKVKAVLKTSRDGQDIVVLLDTGITESNLQPGLRNYLKKKASDGVRTVIIPAGGKDHTVYT